MNAAAILQEALRAQAAALCALADLVASSGPESDGAMVDVTRGHRQARLAVRRGELSGFRVGRRMLVRRADLEEWQARPEHQVRASHAASEREAYLERMARG